MENLETRQTFVELRAKGNSLQKIADELGVSKQTLIIWSRNLQTDIRNQRALEYDNLLFQYQLTRETRIKLYGELLKKVENEISSRNLKDIPTEKLFALYCKTLESIKGYSNTITLESDADWTLEPTKNYWNI